MSQSTRTTAANKAFPRSSRKEKLFEEVNAPEGTGWSILVKRNTSTRGNKCQLILYVKCYMTKHDIVGTFNNSFSSKKRNNATVPGESVKTFQPQCILVYPPLVYPPFVYPHICTEMFQSFVGIQFLSIVFCCW